MNKIHFIFFILFLTACGGSSKVLNEGNAGTVSAKDYPYIEKFYKALRFKANGRLDEAANLLQECLEIRQNDDAVYYALSQIELMRGNDNQSALHIEQAAKLDPKNTWYTQELAYMYFERGNYSAAVENFKKLVEKEPRNIEWLYGYAESLAKAGKYQEAIAALNKTQDQTGPHPELTMQKYRLYMEAGKNAEGEQELLKGLDLFPSEPSIIATLVDHYFRTRQEAKAIAMLERLVAADPNNGRANLALGDIYLRQGKIDQATSAIIRALPAEDADLDSKMKLLIALYDQVTVVSDELIKGLDVLIATYPNKAKPHSIKGDFLLKADKEVEALKAYREALEFDKNQYPIWNQVLIMAYQLGEYEALYAESKSCMEYFPTVATVYLLNGVAANQLRKYDEATEVLSYGLEIVGSDNALKAEFYGQLGESAFGRRDFTSGKLQYEKALSLNGGSNLLRNNYAMRLAFYNRDLELAKSLIDQVFLNGGDLGQYYDTYGLILFRKGDFQEAKVQFEKAFSKSDKDKLILEHLGDVHFKLGDSTKAMDYWAQSLDAGNTDEILKKKLADKKYYDPF
jgi:tetratricopeptide (TPR) repeat protein